MEFNLPKNKEEEELSKMINTMNSNDEILLLIILTARLILNLVVIK